jgi:hypothetical protein
LNDLIVLRWMKAHEMTALLLAPSPDDAHAGHNVSFAATAWLRRSVRVHGGLLGMQAELARRGYRRRALARALAERGVRLDGASVVGTAYIARTAGALPFWTTVALMEEHAWYRVHTAYTAMRAMPNSLRVDTWDDPHTGPKQVRTHPARCIAPALTRNVSLAPQAIPESGPQRAQVLRVLAQRDALLARHLRLHGAAALQCVHGS